MAHALILPIPVKNSYNRIISAGFAQAFLNNTRKSLSVFCLSMFTNISPYAKGRPGEDEEKNFSTLVSKTHLMIAGPVARNMVTRTPYATLEGS